MSFYQLQSNIFRRINHSKNHTHISKDFCLFVCLFSGVLILHSNNHKLPPLSDDWVSEMKMLVCVCVCIKSAKHSARVEFNLIALAIFQVHKSSSDLNALIKLNGRIHFMAVNVSCLDVFFPLCFCFAQHFNVFVSSSSLDPLVVYSSQWINSFILT